MPVSESRLSIQPVVEEYSAGVPLLARNKRSRSVQSIKRSSGYLAMQIGRRSGSSSKRQETYIC